MKVKTHQENPYCIVKLDRYRKNLRYSETVWPKENSDRTDMSALIRNDSAHVKLCFFIKRTYIQVTLQLPCGIPVSQLQYLFHKSCRNNIVFLSKNDYFPLRSTKFCGREKEWNESIHHIFRISSTLFHRWMYIVVNRTWHSSNRAGHFKLQQKFI